MIKLGSKVKDKITGFTGIAMSHIHYLTGCDQIGIAPPVDKDGKMQDTMYFDVNRIEIISEDNPLHYQPEKERVGGPNRDAPRG